MGEGELPLEGRGESIISSPGTGGLPSLEDDFLQEGFGEDLSSLVQVERHKAEQSENDAIVQSFNSELFKKDVSDEISRLLKVPQEYQESEQGLAKLQEIADYLFNEVKLQKIEEVQGSLNGLFEHIKVPKSYEHGGGLTDLIFGYIQFLKKHQADGVEMERGSNVWGTGKRVSL